MHIEAKGSQVVLDAPPEPVIAEVDSTRIERILRNLIVNAIEHAEGSRIDVTIAKSDDAVAVRVRDHGIGMSPDVVKQVFDRFYARIPPASGPWAGRGWGCRSPWRTPPCTVARSSPGAGPRRVLPSS